jgi:hypothetical protein
MASKYGTYATNIVFDSIEKYAPDFKGTVARDFRPSVFFVNQSP